MAKYGCFRISSRDTKTGVVLARSSQPEVGWLGWRNQDDESFFRALATSCVLNPGTANTLNKATSLDDDDQDAASSEF